MEPYFVDDLLGGHFVFEDFVQPADPVVFRQRVRQMAMQYMEEDIWGMIYMDGQVNHNRRRMDMIHYSWAREEIYREMGRLSRTPSTYLELEGRAIMRGPPMPVPVVPVPPVQPVVLEQPVLIVVPVIPVEPVIELVEDEDVEVAMMGAMVVVPDDAPPAPPAIAIPPGGAAQLIAMVAAQWAAEAAANPNWVQPVDPEVDDILAVAAEEAAAEVAEQEAGIGLDDLEEEVAEEVESDAESGVTSASD